MKNTKEFERIEKRLSKFNTLEAAKRCVYYHAVKPSAIILGDDGLYWVATRGDAERLYRMGYQYAD